MRWTVVVGCLLVVSCGGRSRDRAPPGLQAGGDGTASGSGGTGAAPGADGGGAVGGAEGGRSGTHPVWTEPPATGDSPECLAYKAVPDLVAACRSVLSCEPTLGKYLEFLAEQAVLEQFYARTGCGLVEIMYPGYGSRIVFDTDGTLVGYQAISDAPHGPCATSTYARGVHLEECAELRECAISSDAATAAPGESVCRCACPDPPPADGIANVELECADRPSRGWTCGEDLARWGELGEQSSSTGIVWTGCGATVVRIMEAQGALDCVYDASEVFVGRMLTSYQIGCPGVTAWQGGTPYTSCPDQVECTFGSGEPASPAPHCGAYPYR